jgi:S-methylmethionine-dependent homocysteine/selenocysteine methylase
MSPLGSSEIVVLDGGMGRELLRIGAPFRQPEWSALALTEGPDQVIRAHSNFIEAGATVITTNSYALVPFHIGEQRFRNEAQTLAALSGKLARDAALSAQSNQNILVAGSLPPLFGSYRPDLFDAARSAAIIDPLVAGLAEHVDIWLGETLGSIIEATTVREALTRSQNSLPLWLSFTLQNGEQLRSGELIVDAVRAAVDLHAEAILFNCSKAEHITSAITIAINELASQDHHSPVRVGGYANRFLDGHDDDGGANEHLSGLRTDLDASLYREVVDSWLREGATIVGGCCGITPEHIAELAKLRDNAG